MFDQKFDVFQLNEWGGIVKVTHIISTEHLWLHFNFTFFQDEHVNPYVFSHAKGQIGFAIITYDEDDEMSFERAKSLFNTHVQQNYEQKKLYWHKRILTGAWQSPVPEDLQLLSLALVPDNTDSVGPGILAAICPPNAELDHNRSSLSKQTKYISKSNEEFFTNEKDSIYWWLFEQYAKRYPNMKVTDELVAELKSGLKTEVEASNQECTLL